ncbi:cyclodehydratase [Mycobacterium sp. 3519A]|uniref:cyclodehydratase n=1 Tax=Mycobacterium sp. 3519A TaxID=2057184 RepID=UPI000C7D8112|nr:cyclodehydratase [Mycobacterium sp. 3519A]
MQRYTLDPAMPVLLRPDGAVQVGWDPRRAVLVHPPAGLTAAGLADLLRALQAGATLADLQERFEVDAGDLVVSLIEAGVVSAAPERRRCPSVRVHGRGPLSDLVARGLRCSGARVTRSSVTQAAPPGTTDLVVLADFLVAEPRVVRDLHTARVAHLPVRLRDGAGLVGPLVIPGVTSCLQCADLHRTDRDAAWPAVASQLRNVVGSADRATVLGTAALALNQVDRVIRAVRDGHAVAAATEPPPTLDTTLEFNVDAGAIVARRWSRHPRCWC